MNSINPLAQDHVSVFGHSTQVSSGVTQTEGDADI